jgi:hypothetical protein
VTNDREARRRRARQLFRQRVQRELKKADEAFKGRYKAEIDGLLGLSRSEVDAISPGVSDVQTYDRLIMVVKEASRVNLAQAELASRIRSLGEVAVSIAKRVPSLAGILG